MIVKRGLTWASNPATLRAYNGDKKAINEQVKVKATIQRDKGDMVFYAQYVEVMMTGVPRWIPDITSMANAMSIKYI